MRSQEVSLARTFVLVFERGDEVITTVRAFVLRTASAAVTL